MLHLTFDEFAADFARARDEQPRQAAGVVVNGRRSLTCMVKIRSRFTSSAGGVFNGTRSIYDWYAKHP